MAFNNPNVPWSEVERIASGRRARSRRRQRCPRVVAQTRRLRRRARRPAEPPGPGRRRRPAPRPLRRAARALQLQLPRRRLPPRDARRGGRPARAGRARADRPRRHVRRRPLQRRRARARRPGRVRRRAVPRPARAAGRRARPGRLAPAGARAAARRLPPALPGHLPRPARRRREGPARSTTSTRSSTSWPGTSSCSPAAARAPVRRALAAHGPAAARAELARLVDWFGRRHVAVELIDHRQPARRRRQRPPRRDGRRAAAADGRVEQRPLRPPRRRRRGRRGRRGPGAALGRGAGGLAAAVRAGVPALRDGAAAPLRAPLPGRGRARRGARRRSRVRPEARRARPAAVPGAARARRDVVPARADLGAAPPPATAPATRTPKAYAQLDHELDVIEKLGLPRLLPRRVGHRPVLQGAEHPLPGPRIRRELRGLLRAGHLPRRPGEVEPAVRALPRAGAGRAAGHRHRHRVRPPRGGHPVRLRKARPVPRRAGRQRHHLPRRRRRSATRRRRSATVPGQQDAFGKLVDRWGRVADAADRRRHPRTTSWSWPPGWRTSRATSASTPAAW